MTETGKGERMEVAKEALRYLGAGRNAPEELRRETERLLSELRKTVRPRYVCRPFALRREDANFILDGASVNLRGNSVRAMLDECGAAVLLLCTLGAEFERRLRAMEARDMSKAVILDACGSALVEEGCDAAERELSARFPGRFLTDRFSPGYGDVPLSLQADICRILDASRRLGVCVTDSMTLNPCKSVTAIIGLADRPQRARIRGCACCAMRETCALRKSGASCQL